MSTKSIISHAKLRERASRFADQKASGLTIADWCQQNGISRHSYFYWKRKLKDTPVPVNTMANLVISSSEHYL